MCLITNCGYDGYWHYFMYIIYSHYVSCFYVVANLYIPLYLFHGCVNKITQECGYIFFSLFPSSNSSFFSLPIITQFYYSFIYISQLTAFSWGQSPGFSELVPLEYRSESKAPQLSCTSVHPQNCVNLRSLVNTGVQKSGGTTP